MLTEIWLITVELAPWLLAGVAIAGVAYALLPAGVLRRQLNGPGGVVRAVAFGVPLPLCSCGVIPVGIGLKKQGAGDGAAVGFLISTPQTGVDSVMVTASLLGWPLALFKVAVALVTGLVGGLLANRFSKSAESVEQSTDDAVSDDARPSPLRRAVRHADDLVRSIWLWLVIGVVVSAALTVWLPEGGLDFLASRGPLVAMAFALVVSLPMYVCATESAPIAAALVANGLPLGAAIVFLMAGPATNAATVGAVYRGLGGRALAIYLTTIILGSFAGGMLFEQLLAPHGSPPVLGHAHEHGAPWWGVAAAIALVAWMAWCAWRDASDWLFPKRFNPDPFVSVDSLRSNASLEGEPPMRADTR